MNKSFVFFVIIAALVLAGCSGETASEGMEIEGAWVRAVGGTGAPAGETPAAHGGMETQMGQGRMMAGMNSAAYMVIRNGSGAADRLIKVESDVATAVELHQTQVENEVMSMRPVDGIDLPAGGQAVLEPGGLHIMLIGLKQPLAAGQRVRLTLVFEKAQPLSIEAEVLAP